MSADLALYGSLAAGLVALVGLAYLLFGVDWSQDLCVGRIPWKHKWKKLVFDEGVPGPPGSWWKVDAVRICLSCGIVQYRSLLHDSWSRKVSEYGPSTLAEIEGLYKLGRSQHHKTVPLTPHQRDTLRKWIDSVPQERDKA